MNNGVILTVLVLFVLFFLGLILTYVTSVLFVPILFTPKKILDEITKIINPKDNDIVADLGSGDGRVLIHFAKKVKIKGFGYDISPLMPILSKIRKLFEGQIKADITFDVASFFDLKLNEYDIIYCNLNARSMEILGKKFKKDLKDTFVYSYRLEIPDRKYSKKHTLSNGEKLFEYIY